MCQVRPQPNHYDISIWQRFTYLNHFQIGLLLADIITNHIRVLSFQHRVPDKSVTDIPNVQIDFSVFDALIIQHKHQLFVLVNYCLIIIF